MSPLIGLALLLSPARALRLHQGCPGAELVVVAEVSGLETHWRSGALGGLETVADLSVQQVLQGSPPDDLRVAWLGGQLGDVRLDVPGQPELAQDHRYALLLTPADDGDWTVVDGPDGVLPLAHDAAVPALPELCHAP